ncbi:MAG: LamG domain-containing protein [Thermodesulfobacteriota bacterium]|nr:LamG domain-containing protein [Thermodesulfobacteriota bacterium]
MRVVLILFSCIFILSPFHAKADLNDGLICYYPFNGSADDESENNNHGTVSGATLTEDKDNNHDSAYYFDGIDDYINIGNNASLRPDLPVSFTAWVRIDSNKYQGVFRNNYYTDQYTGIIVNFMDTGHIGIGFGDGGGTDITDRRTIISGKTFDTGTWYHIAGILRGPTDMELFINGVLDNSTYYDGSGGSLYYNDRDGLIGLHGRTTSGLLFFHGAMDELRFYNRALSASEICDLAGCNTPSVPSISSVGKIGLLAILLLMGVLAAKRDSEMQGHVCHHTNGMERRWFQ